MKKLKTSLDQKFYFSMDFTKSGTKDNQFFVEGYAATTDLDRQSDIIVADALKEAAPTLLAQGNTVFFNHDYNRCIGRLDDASGDDKGLRVKIYVSEWEQELRKKIEEGIISKFSIGGRVLAGERLTPSETLRRYPQIKNKPVDPVNIIYKMELFEVSIVGLPANAKAEFRHKSLYEALKDVELEDTTVENGENLGQIPDNTTDKTLPKEVAKGAMPMHETPCAPEDHAWDGPAQIAAASIEDLKVICAWYDEQKPDVKESYKLPHHLADGHQCVWKGVRAAMGSLMGARGGVSIPDSDKEGVYKHLSKHYEQFKKQPPELKNYTPEELKNLGFDEEVIVEEVKKDQAVVVGEEPVKEENKVKETVTTQSTTTTERVDGPNSTQIVQETNEATKVETILNDQIKVTETVETQQVRTYTVEEVKAIQLGYETQLTEKEATITSLKAEVERSALEKASAVSLSEKLESVVKSVEALNAKVKEIPVETKKDSPIVKTEDVLPVKGAVKLPEEPGDTFLKILTGKQK